ncbi:MAG: DNA repair protein RecN [Fusobacteriaceae bacterium]
MLRELKIENLAIIDALDMELENGLITLTGETGAGKSIIMSGVNLLIGEKGDMDLIRDGATSLLAQGVFEVDENQIAELRELGLEIEGTEVIIRRTLDRSGRGKATVNNIRVPMSSLKDIMKSLVDIVGQHSHQMLLSKSNHIKLLDKFLNDDGKKLKNQVGKTYGEYQQVKKKIQDIEIFQKEIIERKDFYRFQLEEIEEINPRINEDNELEEEYKKLFNAGKIKEKLQNSENFLRDGEINALNFIHNSRKSIELLCKYGKEYEEIFEKLEKIYYELEDVVDLIVTLDEDIESNDRKLEKVILRLDSINKLKMKYGFNIGEILSHREMLEEKLKSLDENGFQLKNLFQDRDLLEKKYLEQSKLLRNSRYVVSKKIEENLRNELAFLNMVDANFYVKFEELSSWSPFGMDSVEFFISTNAGQIPKPLWKIASGGEVSRIMLALKVLFSKVDSIAMLLFDEIDSGVGGETVRKIGQKLQEIGENSQVICITHSPAIAAKANQQFYIEKNSENGKTLSSVKLLTSQERVMEIGRMLAGKKISSAVIDHAKELLNGR